ncbi:hypothetical protein T4D_14423 [Trichinella pseudospiralis]|uniref:Uncharacterized protein n=1 Tax=Trichinella pseudospiralis TaxID=6337 RepID=A0A0V1FEI9_TRIPS|nr:hypothetical protein T4D_14423 [Trichinella pseudospiralis]
MNVSGGPLLLLAVDVVRKEDVSITYSYCFYQDRWRRSRTPAINLFERLTAEVGGRTDLTDLFRLFSRTSPACSELYTVYKRSVDSLFHPQGHTKD